MELQIALPTPLAQTFTYTCDISVARGTRVLVPFGSRQMVGVVIGPATIAENERKYALKAVTSVIDQEPVYSPTMLSLAEWMATYYMHPIGEVLRSMLPASTAKSVSYSYLLTDNGVAAIDNGAHPHSALLQSLYKKKRSLGANSLKKKLKSLRPGEVSEELLDALIKAKLLQVEKAKRISARPASGTATVKEHLDIDHQAPALTYEQRAALDELVAKGIHSGAAGGVKPFLLQGVTGSGKTEVYLNLIAANEAGRTGQTGGQGGVGQTLVLVPEISLTPQMTRVFERRFPGEVAVVHSAMTDGERWNQLEKLRSGEASILIGPRSAVFAPFKNLSLIIVDEEHDSSYKQGTGLAYHGRDVAIVRGKMEGCTVVLGSATPSLETYWNALSGKYHHLKLTQRVGARPLPTIETIVTPGAGKRGTLIGNTVTLADGAAQDLPIAPEIISALKANQLRGHQAIVLVNRRGYAFYLFDVREKQPYLCKNCSISMTLHARSTMLHCHYCDHQMSLRAVQAELPNAKFVAVGYGSQKAEDCLNEMLPESRIVRLDSDVVNERDVLPKTLEKFRQGDIDILVGTQILAKGHDFPKVTLIAILEIDQILNLPDFRAGERTFQLLVQAAGRAGRAELPGHVVVQSARLDHPVVQTALRQDFEAFAAQELDFRRAHLYPPFAKMALVEVNSENLTDLVKYCTKISQWINWAQLNQGEALKGVRIMGPAAPGIEIVRKRHRRTLLFCSADIATLRRVVTIFWAQFSKAPRGMRIRIDIDPQSLI